MPLSDLPAFRFQTLEGVSHAISTRHGGVSQGPYRSLNLGYGTDDDEDCVARNRSILGSALGLEPDQMFGASLTHGNEVSVFKTSEPSAFPARRSTVRPGSAREGTFFRTDGVVSDVAGLHFLLTFADCVPLLFADPVRGVVGAAHAGWRGTAASIGPNVVQAMAENFGSDPSHIVAGIGPSVGPCCYSIQRNVLATFEANGAPAVSEEREGRLYLDLWASNELHIRQAGVSRIERSNVCTACNTETYFSHRAEAGVTGRFGMLAGLPQ